MESKASKDDLFFKLFYRVEDNEVKFLENKDLNNIFNYSTDIHYDFFKVNVTEVLEVCNLENYNSKIQNHYLNNENEYLYDGNTMREFYRNRTDKCLVLESIDNYLEIFTGIYVYEGILSPTYQRLVDFIELDAIKVFTDMVSDFFTDLQENLECHADIQGIILGITHTTRIFQDLTSLIRHKMNEDLIQYHFSKDYKTGFLPMRQKRDKREIWTDSCTIDTYPHHYDFLKKLFPEATRELEKIVSMEIFDEEDVTVQLPISKAIPHLKFTAANNIYHHPEVFINNALINFYRRPELKTLTFILSVVEDSFKLQKNDKEREVFYIYGIDISRDGTTTVIPPETLKTFVKPMQNHIKLIYRNLPKRYLARG